MLTLIRSVPRVSLTKHMMIILFPILLQSFFNALRILVRTKNIKGLVVGYPLTNKNEQTLQCHYVEKFIEYMWDYERIKLPVTLVNEYNSSMEAKAQLAEIVSGKIGLSPEKRMLEDFKRQMLGQGSVDIKQLAEREVMSRQVHSMGDPMAQMRPEVMLRKGIYDKIAAKIILQQFIDIYNKEKEDERVNI